MKKLFSTACVLTLVILSSSRSEARDYNHEILAAVRSMPRGGAYASSREQKLQTVKDLNQFIAVREGLLSIQLPAKAGPSFCSSAVPLVLFKVLAQLQTSPHYQPLRSEILNRAIDDIGTPEEVISGRRDGHGIFGHLNSDGPGLAVLFRKLSLGKNFLPGPGQDYSEAKPGDFMKIFWNEHIGKGERGHLVIYLGESSHKVRVWSSNLKNDDGTSGYGSVWVDKSRIVRAVFSRLQYPENFAHWLNLSNDQRTDAYLVALTQRSSSPEEMARAVLP